MDSCVGMIKEVYYITILSMKLGLPRSGFTGDLKSITTALHWASRPVCL